jgi:hypothetical protein
MHKRFSCEVGDVKCEGIILNGKPVLTEAYEFGYKLVLEPLMCDPEFMQGVEEVLAVEEMERDANLMGQGIV